jgi:hypothetical protein
MYRQESFDVLPATRRRVDARSGTFEISESFCGFALDQGFRRFAHKGLLSLPRLCRLELW